MPKGVFMTSPAARVEHKSKPPRHSAQLRKQPRGLAEAVSEQSAMQFHIRGVQESPVPKHQKWKIETNKEKNMTKQNSQRVKDNWNLPFNVGQNFRPCRGANLRESASKSCQSIGLLPALSRDSLQSMTALLLQTA